MSEQIYSLWKNRNKLGEIELDELSIGSAILESTPAEIGTIAIVLYDEAVVPPMTVNEYQHLAVSTDVPNYETIRSRISDDKVLRLLHGLIGLVTEVGEVADILKRHIFYGKELKITGKESISEEAGDISWYLALVADTAQMFNPACSLEYIFNRNILKLAERYPDKFTEHAALNRDLDKENKILE